MKSKMTCLSCYHSLGCDECGSSAIYCTLKAKALRTPIDDCEDFMYEPGTDETESCGRVD